MHVGYQGVSKRSRKFLKGFCGFHEAIQGGFGSGLSEVSEYFHKKFSGMYQRDFGGFLGVFRVCRSFKGLSRGLHLKLSKCSGYN